MSDNTSGLFSRKLEALLKWFVKIVQTSQVIIVLGKDGAELGHQSRDPIQKELYSFLHQTMIDIWTNQGKKTEAYIWMGSSKLNDAKFIIVKGGPASFVGVLTFSDNYMEEITPYIFIVAEKVSRLIDGRPMSPVIPDLYETSGTHVFKVILAGDGAVGKTSLVHRFVEGSFSKDYTATIGTSIMKKKVCVDSKVEADLIIWDLAGQDQFKRVRQTYYQNAEACMIVFDLTQRTTFNSVPKWIQETQLFGGPDIQFMVVGNKIDLPNRQVSSQEAKELCAEFDIDYIESSAKTGVNVENAFFHIATQLLGATEFTDSVIKNLNWEILEKYKLVNKNDRIAIEHKKGNRYDFYLNILRKTTKNMLIFMYYQHFHQKKENVVEIIDDLINADLIPSNLAYFIQVMVNINRLEKGCRTDFNLILPIFVEIVNWFSKFVEEKAGGSENTFVENILSPKQIQIVGLLNNIESILRNLIQNIMKDSYGETWFEDCLKPEERAEIKKRWSDRQLKNPNHRIVDEFTFNNYKQILTGKKGKGGDRKAFFEKFFGRNYVLIMGLIEKITEIRNRVDHNNWELLDLDEDLKALQVFLRALNKE